MREYFKRVLTSWPTWSGTIIEVATAIYGLGLLLGYWSLPQDVWSQIVAAAGVILAGLYKLFTIGNNPTNSSGF